MSTFSISLLFILVNNFFPIPGSRHDIFVLFGFPLLPLRFPLRNGAPASITPVAVAVIAVAIQVVCVCVENLISHIKFNI